MCMRSNWNRTIFSLSLLPAILLPNSECLHMILQELHLGHMMRRILNKEAPGKQRKSQNYYIEISLGFMLSRSISLLVFKVVLASFVSPKVDSMSYKSIALDTTNNCQSRCVCLKKAFVLDLIIRTDSLTHLTKEKCLWKLNKSGEFREIRITDSVFHLILENDY